MWGTSFPGDKLTVDFGNEFGAPFIGDRSNFCFLTKKSVPNNFGLLQQYLRNSGPSRWEKRGRGGSETRQ
jgi:hypothetical protein